MITETVWADTPADLDDAIQTAARAHHNIMPAQIHLAVRPHGFESDDPPSLVCLLVWERD